MLRVDCSDAWLHDKFTVNGFLFDEMFERVEILQLEGADGRVGRVFEEDGLAVAAILENLVSIPTPLAMKEVYILFL